MRKYTSRVSADSSAVPGRGARALCCWVQSVRGVTCWHGIMPSKFKFVDCKVSVCEASKIFRLVEFYVYIGTSALLVLPWVLMVI